jgi:hypothetical protein
MFEWFWKLFTAVPEVGVQPEPVSVNPTPSEREKRNRNRIARLQKAIQYGDTRPELQRELDRRLHGGR